MADLSPGGIFSPDLKGANLAGADLAGANLEGAIAKEDTTWPQGFDPVAAGVTVED